MNQIATFLSANSALIGLSVGWLILIALLAYQFGWQRDLTRLQKIGVILSFLLFGPVFFPFWWIGGAILRMRRFDIPFFTALYWQLYDYEADEDPDEEDAFVIFDTEGKSLRVDQQSSKISIGIRIANDLIKNAVMQVASDVLIQPVSEDQFTVRYRVHGALRNVRELSGEDGKSVVNCIKAISGMDIAERRRPQDGGFLAKSSRGPVRFRVATAGVLSGEKVSIRILDQSATAFELDDVGLATGELQSVKRALQGHSGLVLVCGPTGSGKSTTVHAMLRSIDSVERNVITIEDPIEYVLPNASQIEVNKKAGITFAEILRSVLRQDPDVISIGEIRDAETAKIALQAAQTGHLVFATLHSGSNPAAILRLIDLGCEPQLVASALNVVISQRLLRRLCDHCKSREEFSDDQKANLWKQTVDPNSLFGPRGCSHCHHGGFTGRTGVFDITLLDRDMRNRIAAGKLQVTEDEHAIGSTGTMTAMQVRATQMALAGWTSWDEVQRIATTVE